MIDPLVTKGFVLLATVGAGTAIAVKLLETPATTITPGTVAPVKPSSPPTETEIDNKVLGTRFTLTQFLLCLLPFVLIVFLAILFPRNRLLNWVAYLYWLTVLVLDIFHHGKNNVRHPYFMTLFLFLICIPHDIIYIIRLWRSQKPMSTSEWDKKTDTEYEKYLDAHKEFYRLFDAGTIADTSHKIEVYGQNRSWPPELVQKMKQRMEERRKAHQKQQSGTTKEANRFEIYLAHLKTSPKVLDVYNGKNAEHTAHAIQNTAADWAKTFNPSEVAVLTKTLESKVAEIQTTPEHFRLLKINEENFTRLFHHDKNFISLFHGLPPENVKEQIGYWTKDKGEMIRKMAHTLVSDYQKLNPVVEPTGNAIRILVGKRYLKLEAAINDFEENIHKLETLEEAQKMITDLRTEVSKYDIIVTPEAKQQMETKFKDIEIKVKAQNLK